MKAITLTAPWSTLVAIGAKTIETRSWDTNFRGQVCIHAAKNFPDDARYLVTEEPFSIALAGAWASTLPTACIIAVATIERTWKFTATTVEKIRERSAAGELPPFEADFGDYTEGRFGFRLINIVPLVTTIPARGMLNLWNVPADVERKVREQLAPPPAVEDDECTGVAAKWCPIHGDCKCKLNGHLSDRNCPLHAPDSKHAEVTA